MAEPPCKKPSLGIDYPVAGTSQNFLKTETHVEIGNVSEPDTMEQRLKIVHLTDECLEKIFRFLNLIDLINAAEANVRIAGAAKSFFAQIHQNQCLSLRASHADMINILDSEWHPLAHSFGSDFYLTRDVANNMFKHFGKYIRRIKIRQSHTSNIPYHFISRIADHCSETLEELQISGIGWDIPWYCKKKPFKSLECLVLYQNIYPTKIDNLREVFPNLQRLEFHNCRLIFENFKLEQHFPHLEHLGIYACSVAKFNRTDIPALHRIVNLNPQLKSLRVYDLEDLLNEFSLETMPNIKRLEIPGRWLMFLRQPFDFGNVISLKLGNCECIKGWHHLPPQLATLELIDFEINDQSIALINQCLNLKSLTVLSYGKMNIECVEKLAEKLHHIEEVEFISGFKENSMITNAFSASLVFIQKCNRLRKATATIEIERADARFRINKWHLTKWNEYMEVYREKLKKILVFDWWRWSITHNVKTTDFPSVPCIYDFFGRPCFSTSIINNHIE